MATGKRKEADGNGDQHVVAGEEEAEKRRVAIEESTPWVAAGDGDLDLLRRSLQELNLPFTKADENGFTICHAAAAYNQTHVLRWIFEQAQSSTCSDATLSSVVNAQDSDGDTPLHHCDHVDAARVLIVEGHADPRMLNQDGKTALQLREDDFNEAMEDDEDEDDEFSDISALKTLIEYLKEVAANPQ